MGGSFFLFLNSLRFLRPEGKLAPRLAAHAPEMCTSTNLPTDRREVGSATPAVVFHPFSKIKKAQPEI